MIEGKRVARAIHRELFPAVVSADLFLSAQKIAHPNRKGDALAHSSAICSRTCAGVPAVVPHVSAQQQPRSSEPHYLVCASAMRNLGCQGTSNFRYQPG